MTDRSLSLIAENLNPRALFELTGQSTANSGKFYVRPDGFEVKFHSHGIEKRGFPPDLPSFEIVLSWTADASMKVALAQILRVLFGNAKTVILKNRKQVLHSEEDALAVLQSVLESGEAEGGKW